MSDLLRVRECFRGRRQAARFFPQQQIRLRKNRLPSLPQKYLRTLATIFMNNPG